MALPLGDQHLSVDSIVSLIASFEIIERENYFKKGKEFVGKDFHNKRGKPARYENME